MKRYGQIDLVGNELVDVRLENLASAPTPVSGRVYFNSSDAVAQVHDGSNWIDLNSPDDDFYVGLSNESLTQGADSILIYDDSAAGYKRQTKDNFFQNITGYLPAPVSPAGSNREIQWNDSGNFGASSKLQWSSSDNLIATKTHTAAFSPGSAPGNHGLFIYNDDTSTVLNKYAAIRLQSKYTSGYINVSYIVSYASTAFTDKTNMAFMTRDTAGNYETPLIIDGNTGVQLYYNQNLKFAVDVSGFHVVGTATGDTNLAYIGFYESNESVRQGYVGFGSSGDNDFYVNAEVGQLRLDSTEGIKMTGPVAIGSDVVSGISLNVESSSPDGPFYSTYNGTVDTFHYAGIFKHQISTAGSSGGHGVGLGFVLEDSSAVENYIGKLKFYREAADNTGFYRLELLNAGSNNIVMQVNADGDTFLPDIVQDSETTTMRYNSASGRLSYPISDRTLKKNIRKWEVDAISVLEKFSPKQYVVKNDPAARIRTGWIAQEGVEFIPDMFPFVTKTGKYSISELEILPWIHKAIQQISPVVKSNQERIDELEAEVVRLKKQLE